MEKLSSRKKAAVKVLDEQIETLENALVKYKPLFDELSQLRRARGILMGEGGRSGGLSHEKVLKWFEDHDVDEITVPEMADDMALPQSTIRSHFTRLEGVHYERKGRGRWGPIGEGEEEEEEE